MLSSTHGFLEKPSKYEHLRELEKTLRQAPSYCFLKDDKHIFGTLQGSVPTFLTLTNYLYLLTHTYWYFLKVQTNGYLLRWLNELLVPRLAWSHLACTACIIIQNRRMRELSPKFLRVTSPGEQRSDDYMRPTFTPPRHACFQLITHTLSHYRCIQIIVVTEQGKH